MWLWILGAAVVGGIVWTSRTAKAKQKQKVKPLPFPFPTKAFDVPFAIGSSTPAWPIASSSKHPQRLKVSYIDVDKDVHGRFARRFGASRDGRRHVGMDLFGNIGDIVVATENGTVVGLQHYHLGTWALLEETDTGLVVLYGEIKKNSWDEFGVDIGSKIKRGQPIAHISLIGEDSHMLHFETYTSGVTKNIKWPSGSAAPTEIRNPTLYLLKAKALESGVA